MEHDAVLIGQIVEGAIEIGRGTAERRLQLVVRRDHAAIDEAAQERLVKLSGQERLAFPSNDDDHVLASGLVSHFTPNASSDSTVSVQRS